MTSVAFSNDVAAIYQIAPAVTSWGITPSDTVNFTQGTCRSIYVGTGGSVDVVHPDGSHCVYPSVPSGFYLNVYAIRVNAAATNASGLVAMA